MFYKGEIPFVRLAIPLILGIGFGWFFPQQIGLKIGPVSLIIISIIFALTLAFYKRTPLYRHPYIVGIVVHIFLFVAGYLLYLKSNACYEPIYFTANTDALVLKITSEPQSKGTTIRFKAAVVQSLKGGTFSPTKGKLIVTVKVDTTHQLSPLAYGDALLVPPQFSNIAPPFNPAEFDFRKQLATQGIYHQAFIPQQHITTLQHAGPTSLIAWSLTLRKKLVDKLYTYIPNKEAAALAATLLLGYRTDLSKEMLNTYSQTGTMHVLAVSGMHVGLVFLIISFVLKPLSKKRSTQFLNVVLMISFIWFYALITGFSPSVCRAATMLSFVVVGKAFRKNQNTYNLLAASAFLLLLYNPLYLFDVGFQLSYLAVIGLVYFHPKIYQLIYLKNKPLDTIWNYSALSISAQLATFPLSIYYFHQFPLCFLLSNLFIILPITILMYIGIIFLFVPFVILLKPLGFVLSWIIVNTNTGLCYIQKLPFANVGDLWLTGVQCILMYSTMVCFAWLLVNASKRVFFIFVTLIAILSLDMTYQAIQNQNRHELVFYSLKKNIAIGHIFRGQATIVTDVSSTDKAFDFYIKPTLSSKGATLHKLLSFIDSSQSITYKVRPNFMQFGNFKIIHWNMAFDSLRHSKQIGVDALLLSGNPKTRLSNMINKVRFSMLLIAGTNTHYRIKKWQEEAQLLQIPYRILKDDRALVVDLLTQH